MTKGLKPMLQRALKEARWAEGMGALVYQLQLLSAHLGEEPESWTQNWADDIDMVRNATLQAMT
jgi:hypothetical protein